MFFSLVVALTTAALVSAQDPATGTPPAPDGTAPETTDAPPNTAPKQGKGGASKPGEAAAPPPPAQNALPPMTGGDTLHMVSGTSMTGIQVLRQTPRYYEVQLIPGEPPIQIPRRQVKSVDYDDIDPSRDKLRNKMFPEQEQVTIASGERVTGALRDKLVAPVSAEPMSYKDADLIKVLDDVRTKTATNLTVDQSVVEKPVAQRKWSIEIPPDKTLMVLLREDLVTAIKYVEVIFESDAIIVMTKDAANKRRELAKTDAAGAPADGAAPALDPNAPAPAPGGNPAPAHPKQAQPAPATPRVPL